MEAIVTEWPQFFTATNLEWRKLLRQEKYKYIIIESLRFLVAKQRIILYGFVIMDNHMHLIWQIKPGFHPDAVQRDFLKFTAQKIQADLKRNDPNFLPSFFVNARDRKHQFWERNSLSIELRTHQAFIQKLDYIHNNPVVAGLCKLPEDYLFSSAKFYLTGVDNWGF